MSRVLPIIIGDVPELHQKSQLVKNVKDPIIQELIFDMRETMSKSKGVGLAAPQIGHLLRIIVVSDGGNEFAVINPVIERVSKGKVILEEGCLSLPKIFKDVERPEKVTVSGLDQGGNKIKIKADGWLARVLQHEIDHLEGVLFIDKVKIIDKIKKYGE